MGGDEDQEKTILDIFNEMECEEKLDNSEDGEGTPQTNAREDGSDEIPGILKTSKALKTFDNAVNDAVKAQNTWKDLSALKKADLLYSIWMNLKETSNYLSKSKNEFLTLVDYFNYYTDMAVQTGEYINWSPYGVVVVVLDNSSPYFILGATVPAALAAGCSVIVLAPESIQCIPLFLQYIIQESGAQDGLFNVVKYLTTVDGFNISKKIGKVFYCGSYLSVQKFYKESLAPSFNFFCPNNTAAFILESCDLNAAVDKIVRETWGKNSFFGVTNVVVQESFYKSFLEKLLHRVEQLVLENINSPKFKDQIMSDKIDAVVSKALRAGATVEKCTKYENALQWCPTVIVNYQDQNVDEDVPVLKVLICRTATEGVMLLNNCRYNLGTSVWSEITSQALEISSMLNCPNVWINCHGVFEADVPLQPSGISGDCVLGGSDGMLQYMSFATSNPEEKYQSHNYISDIKPGKIHRIALSAHQAFNNWKNLNRRKHLKEITKVVENVMKLPQSSELINRFAYVGNTFNLSQQSSTQNFSIIRDKIPIGVILLIVHGSQIDFGSVITEAIPPIALGNAVIIVLQEDNSDVEQFVKYCNRILPKNILNVVVGLDVGVELASDPNVQAIWIDRESTVSEKYLTVIKAHAAKTLKRIWIIPKSMSVSQHLYQKECLQNKVVWLTKVDQFP